MNFQVMNSVFNHKQLELITRLLPSLTESQKIWLGGYFTASISITNQLAPELQGIELFEGVNSKTTPKEITILYGSQTGNAQRLAKSMGKALREQGFQVLVSSMSDFKPSNLKKLQLLLIIVSTYGEGLPPDNAVSFYEFLYSNRVPKLTNLRFSVLALGDSSYEFFCRTGKEFDQRLIALGATRLYSRVDCDLDFEEPAAEWLKGVIDGLSEVQVDSSPIFATTISTQNESLYSRTNPFKAEVIENINLNGQGSNKETRHLEISLEGSGLTFKPGDSLGIYPENDPCLVEHLLEEMNWDPKQKVIVNNQGDVKILREALTTYYEITVLTKTLLEQAVKYSWNDDLRVLLAQGNEDELKNYIHGRDLLDFVRDYGPWTCNAQDFVSILRKLPPRLYSIASSLVANPDEVHIAIGAVRYELYGRQRKGVCSVFCAERLHQGDKLPIFIQNNSNFKLPENPNTPLIMVGAGTGIAPYRAFMQEREEIDAKGKTWLFFGDQHFVTDFLYQIEWQKWLENGVLTKMDVAFSRDTKEKVYVQHRMLANSKELFEWLQEGAVFYICGDEKSMGHDVHNILIEIIQKEGGMSRKNAESYLANMQQQKRYQRDVY